MEEQEPMEQGRDEVRIEVGSQADEELTASVLAPAEPINVLEQVRALVDQIAPTPATEPVAEPTVETERTIRPGLLRLAGTVARRFPKLWYQDEPYRTMVRERVNAMWAQAAKDRLPRAERLQRRGVIIREVLGEVLERILHPSEWQALEQLVEQLSDASKRRIKEIYGPGGTIDRTGHWQQPASENPYILRALESYESVVASHEPALYGKIQRLETTIAPVTRRPVGPPLGVLSVELTPIDIDPAALERWVGSAEHADNDETEEPIDCVAIMKALVDAMPQHEELVALVQLAQQGDLTELRQRLDAFWKSGLPFSHKEFRLLQDSTFAIRRAEDPEYHPWYKPLA